MEDKKISEAVELLYKGAKMLSQYCPECKVPLFEDKGKVFCPSCKREVIFEKDLKRENVNADIAVQKHSEDIKVDKENKLESILKDVIANLILELRNAEDVQRMKDVVDLIDRLTNLIEKLKRLRYI